MSFMKGEHMSWVSEIRLAWCMYVRPGHKVVQASDEARGRARLERPGGLWQFLKHTHKPCSLLSSYWGHQAPRASDHDPTLGSSRVES